MKVMVVSPEASGSKWVARLLRKHPSITRVRHASYPENTGKDRWYPDIAKEKPDAVVVCCRDETVTRRSQERQGYDKLKPPGNVLGAVVRISGQLRKWDGPVAIIGYESLVQWPEQVLRQTFWLLGVNPSLYDYSAVKVVEGEAVWPTDEEMLQNPLPKIKCPACESTSIEIESGLELNVRELEIDG